MPSADETIEDLETQFDAALEGLVVATEQLAIEEAIVEVIAEVEAELAIEAVVEEMAEASDAETDAAAAPEGQAASAE